MSSSKNKIKNIKRKQKKLLDMKLDELINDEKYLEKNNKFENEIKDLEEEIKFTKNDDFEEKAKQMLELAGGFYTSYFRWDKELKVEIIKKLMLELSIDSKKELYIEETPLFKSSKMLNLYNGIPKGNWTPVWTVRGSRPSH